MILAYETSTNICSVAFQNKEGEVWSKHVEGRGVHSDHVFLFTQEFMNEHEFAMGDLDAVLVSNGPGSYTGLRIAASALKGLLFGVEVDLFAVNTLASLAMVAEQGNADVHAIIDARRTHVYHQAFTRGKRLEALGEAKLLEISELEGALKAGQSISGTGINRLNKERLEGISVYDNEFISAESLLELYQLPNFKEYCVKTNVEALNPNYISSSQINNTGA